MFSKIAKTLPPKKHRFNPSRGKNIEKVEGIGDVTNQENKWRFRVQMSWTKFKKLLPTEAIRIENILEDKNANADKHLKEHLPIINCDCGTEILLLPDLQAMNRAIKALAAEHRKKRKNAQSKTIASSNISQR
ncbi:MAG: hypothetical protein ABSA75_11150 [Candidatus Bathyarchaeia archaeon]|jgi:hypothetical protein